MGDSTAAWCPLSIARANPALRSPLRACPLKKSHTSDACTARRSVPPELGAAGLLSVWARRNQTQRRHIQTQAQAGSVCGYRERRFKSTAALGKRATLPSAAQFPPRLHGALNAVVFMHAPLSAQALVAWAADGLGVQENYAFSCTIVHFYAALPTHVFLRRTIELWITLKRNRLR